MVHVTNGWQPGTFHLLTIRSLLHLEFPILIDFVPVASIQPPHPLSHTHIGQVFHIFVALLCITTHPFLELSYRCVCLSTVLLHDPVLFYEDLTCCTFIEYKSTLNIWHLFVKIWIVFRTHNHGSPYCLLPLFPKSRDIKNPVDIDLNIDCLLHTLEWSPGCTRVLRS